MAQDDREKAVDEKAAHHERAHDDESHDTQSVAGSQFPLPPPDGGLHAWLKVLGGFLIYINIWFVSFHTVGLQIADSPEGLHAIIRRLPSVLCVYNAFLFQPFGNILDRYCTGLAAYSRRYTFRPALRHWIFPFHALCGELPRRVWHHDAQFVQELLAGLPCAGCVYGLGCGPAVYP